MIHYYCNTIHRGGSTPTLPQVKRAGIQRQKKKRNTVQYELPRRCWIRWKTPFEKSVTNTEAGTTSFAIQTPYITVSSTTGAGSSPWTEKTRHSSNKPQKHVEPKTLHEPPPPPKKQTTSQSKNCTKYIKKKTHLFECPSPLPWSRSAVLSRRPSSAPAQKRLPRASSPRRCRGKARTGCLADRRGPARSSRPWHPLPSPTRGEARRQWIKP